MRKGAATTTTTSLDTPTGAPVRQTEGTTTRVAESLLTTLSRRLTAQDTVTDLFRTAASDDFKADVAKLDADDLKALRTTYHERMTALDGKVKLEQFDRQIVRIVDIDFWHSDVYDNDGVTLYLRPESAMDKKYKALTSSAPIVRFANALGALPTESAPVRVMLALEPVTDTQRAAQGQKRWSIKRLPMPTEHPNGGGSPF